jgi:quercetin dioxygenase-like cupin family protein
MAEQQGKLLPLIGTLRVSGGETDGAFELIEYTGPLQPPPHVHRHREEVFYVLDGQFTFTVGTEVIDVGAGGTVLIPRGTRHGFTATEGSRALFFVAPAGLEGFFEELGAGVAAGRSGPEMREALAGKYDSIPAD